MNNFLKITAFFLLVASLIACRPFSKESYLEKYDKFITEVSEKGAKYTEKDWKKADAISLYEFMVNFYRKFCPQLMRSKILN